MELRCVRWRRASADAGTPNRFTAVRANRPSPLSIRTPNSGAVQLLPDRRKIATLSDHAIIRVDNPYVHPQVVGQRLCREIGSYNGCPNAPSHPLREPLVEAR